MSCNTTIALASAVPTNTNEKKPALWRAKDLHIARSFDANVEAVRTV